MKFYKITNEVETHNDLTYHDGLNEDILPFNPFGDCTKGGIYFSREDILVFLNCGPWIREVNIPEGEEVYLNPGKPVKWKAHKVFLKPRKKIDLEVVKALIKEGADIHADYDYVLQWAAGSGQFDMVELLVSEGANIHARGEYSLQRAVRYGHFNVVKFLVEKGANIHVDNDNALQRACINSDIIMVKFLVEKGANIHNLSNYTLRVAFNNDTKDYEVIKFLLEEGFVGGKFIFKILTLLKNSRNAQNFILDNVIKFGVSK